MTGFSITADVIEADREAVLKWLRDFNFEKNRAFMEHVSTVDDRKIFCCARNDSGEVIGGVLAESRLEWVSINIMSVAPGRRKLGVGTALLKEAERIAMAHGCKRACVDTMSYQGPEFYRKNGYHEAGRFPNWDSHGHDKIYLIKNLTPTD